MDLESVPKDVWQKAEERAAFLRPLAALDETPAHLVRVAAIDLRISERWHVHSFSRQRTCWSVCQSVSVRFICDQAHK